MLDVSDFYSAKPVAARGPYKNEQPVNRKHCYRAASWLERFAHGAINFYVFRSF